MTKNKYSLSMDIPTHAGVIVLLVVSFFVAWFTIRTGEKIIDNAPQSKIYNSQKDVQKMINGKER